MVWFLTQVLKLLKRFWFIPITLIIAFVIYQKDYFPDFDFYKSDKVKLIDTPVLVKEINQIGELITAEYYGEVYGDLLAFYFKMSDQDLEYPNDSIKKNFPYITEFKKSYYTNKTTRSQMRNLVYIGRGWVKAGIDLADLSEKDIVVSGDTLLLNLNPPEILIHDINPWYIKDDETSVKGFELFIERRKSWKFTDAEVKATKSICKEKLIADAIDKEILSKANASAKTVLTNFLSLLGFKYVEITFYEK